MKGKRVTTQGCFTRVDKEDLSRGMVLAAPGSITPHTKFKASVYAEKRRRWSSYAIF